MPSNSNENRELEERAAHSAVSLLSELKFVGFLNSKQFLQPDEVICPLLWGV